jgi:hypothetical protein
VDERALPGNLQSRRKILFFMPPLMWCLSLPPRHFLLSLSVSLSLRPQAFHGSINIMINHFTTTSQPLPPKFLPTSSSSSCTLHATGNKAPSAVTYTPCLFQGHSLSRCPFVYNIGSLSVILWSFYLNGLLHFACSSNLMCWLYIHSD